MDSTKSLSNPQCRACLCKKETFMHLNAFSDCGNRMKIYEMFFTVTPELAINTNCDKLTNFICNPCFSKLKMAYNFQRMCIKNDKQLRKMVFNQNSKNNNDFEMHQQKNLKCTQTNRNCYESLIDKRMSENGLKTQTEFCNDNNEINEHNECQNMKTIIDCSKLDFEKSGSSSNITEISDSVTAAIDAKELNKIQKTKEPKKNFLCTICGKVFNSSCNLNQHMLRHSNERRNYECPQCPSKFPCLSDKLKHIKIHNKTKKFFCESCGSSFSRSDSLRKHIKIHTGDKPFKCECGMSFVFSYHLQRHKRTHSGEKRFKCDYCDKDFVEKFYLFKHLRQHLGENIYVCQQCPQTFKYNKELRDHVAEHYKAQKEIKNINNV